MDSKKQLGYFLFFIHLIIIIVPIYTVLYSVNIKHILFAVSYYLLVLFHWHVIDCCFITILENFLIKGTISEGKCDSFFMSNISNKSLQHYLSKSLNGIALILCLFFPFIGLYRIYLLTN